MFDGFETRTIDTGGATVFVRLAGSGPPLLLLHGFPETHLMWRDIAPLLSHDFTIVCADLPGYGQSGCPASTPDHAPYSKRAMARQMVTAMGQLGFENFSVAGHDRGGRVAYRLALDHPQQIERLAVLDVLPIEIVWERADARLALSFWPWSLLAQPEPLPERILVSVPDVIVDNALGGWGSHSSAFPTEVRAAYIESLQDSARAHAICEEYRAAATIDRDHDRADHASGKKITSPLLVLWSAEGAVGSWYDSEGGPLPLWQTLAVDVQGEPINAGHFFPEELPQPTADALLKFFRSP